MKRNGRKVLRGVKDGQLGWGNYVLQHISARKPRAALNFYCNVTIFAAALAALCRGDEALSFAEQKRDGLPQPRL